VFSWFSSSGCTGRAHTHWHSPSPVCWPPVKDLGRKLVGTWRISGFSNSSLAPCLGFRVLGLGFRVQEGAYHGNAGDPLRHGHARVWGLGFRV
jgi:hypothetical protein